ncbi:hypothetical protein CEJ86_28395 [Sinorhizobium meliloti]|uniref:Uncharacterized protein n=1 Tax=Rhizobium meliloti TaxID=382 RepID=A0A2J0YVA8_RHIML|nr:hypothetical protein CEJ86_28395 [Sinorhizobium meliloti]
MSLLHRTLLGKRLPPANQASGISKCHITQPPRAPSERVRANLATDAPPLLITHRRPQDAQSRNR